MSEAKAIVHRYVQAVIDGDLETVEGLQHPDLQWWILGVGDINRDSYTASVRDSLLTASTRSVNVTGITAERDRVAYEAVSEMMFPGKVHRDVYHNILIIQDGLIIEGREYLDPRAVVENI